MSAHFARHMIFDRRPVFVTCTQREASRLMKSTTLSALIAHFGSENVSQSYLRVASIHKVVTSFVERFGSLNVPRSYPVPSSCTFTCAPYERSRWSRNEAVSPPCVKSVPVRRSYATTG